MQGNRDLLWRIGNEFGGCPAQDFYTESMLHGLCSLTIWPCGVCSRPRPANWPICAAASTTEQVRGAKPSIPTTTASPWPCAAYFSAAVFIGASGATNVIYGWQKGTDLPSSLVWTGVAGAVAVVFALSWPALMRSFEAKRWCVARVALIALVLAGTYSVTAALGSVAGARTNAATQENAVTDVRTKTQAAYDAAKAELASLKLNRPVAELMAMRDGWRRAYHNQPLVLGPEQARAKRRAELEAKIEREAGKHRPPHVAISLQLSWSGTKNRITVGAVVRSASSIS